MRKYQFQRQIMLKNIIVVTIVTALMIFVILVYLVRTNEAAFEEQADVQLRGITSQLDNTLQIADGVALQLAANQQVIQIFDGLRTYEGNNNYFVDNSLINYELTQNMISYMLKQNFYRRICLFDKNKNLAYVGNLVDYGFLKKDCPDQSVFEDTRTFFEESGKARLFRVDSADPFVKGEIPTISVLREIKNYQLIPSECLGYVQVQIAFDSFSDYEELLGKDTECFILSQDMNEILYSLQSSRDMESVKELLKYPDGTFQKGVYCKREELPEYGLSVFIVSKNTSLIISMIYTFMWTLLVLGAVILILCIGQIQVIKKTTEPIAQMCDMLEGLQIDENFQEIPIVAEQEVNELRQLNLAFDGLVKNLKLSMEKVMSSKVNEIQSQMFAMQSQMNPHFIHNILTIISGMAETEEEGKIPEICEKLSDMIRYSTNYTESYVDLKDEIRHAENYLELMKIRYEEKFRYTMVYVGERQEGLLPKFVVQPLLENCFSHAFNTKPFPWDIFVQIFVSERCWEIEIKDNGGGIEPEKLDLLKEELQQMRLRDMNELMQELKIGGLSIRNVYARLYIAYGENMIFEMKSSKNGTCITVGGYYENTGDGGGG